MKEKNKLILLNNSNSYRSIYGCLCKNCSSLNLKDINCFNKFMCLESWNLEIRLRLEVNKPYFLYEEIIDDNSVTFYKLLDPTKGLIILRRYHRTTYDLIFV